MDEVGGASGFSQPMRYLGFRAAGSSDHEDGCVPSRNFHTLPRAYIDRFLREDDG